MGPFARYDVLPVDGVLVAQLIVVRNQYISMENFYKEKDFMNSRVQNQIW